MGIRYLGPAGGPGGGFFADESNPDQPNPREIKGVIVRNGQLLDSITTVFTDGSQANHGGPGGGPDQVIILEPGETILGISGKCGQYVNSISIYTNLRKYGPYGGEGGNDYWLVLPHLKVVGFWGRSGTYIDAIGIIVTESA